VKRKWLVLISVISIALLCLCGCSTGGSTAPSAVSADGSDDGSEVEIAVGGTLTVTLESNATTGFQWELVSISDQSVLEKQSNTYNAPEDSGLVGAPGEEVWVFKALKKGTSTISMAYSRPWEGGEQGAQTFTLSVVVK
jgi:inhibitor of cysteine peptidase